MPVVLTTLAATLFIQLGYFFWKLSAARQPLIGNASIIQVMTALFKDWQWLLGLFSTVIGWILFIQATALGEISVVQPLMSAGDIILILLAITFLHERLSNQEWLGLGITVIGAVILSFTAEPRVGVTSENHVLWLMFGLIAAAAGTLLLYGKFIANTEITLAIVVGLAFGAGAMLTEALTTGLDSIDAKIITNPILLGVIGTNVTGLIALQAAFQRGRASIVVPLQLAVANCITVLAGAFVFSEQIDHVRLLGISLIIVGTLLLKSKA